MSNDDSQKKLRVSFEFPGASGVLTIHVNHVVASKEDSDEYSMPIELEMMLSSVPGLMIDSVWTRAQMYSITTEIGTAFDRDELLIDIANALGAYFGMDGVELGTVTDRRPVSRHIFTGY